MKAHIGKRIIAVLFSAIILISFVGNIGCLWQPVQKFLSGNIEFAEFTSSLADLYRSDLSGREDYISLNGAYAALTGVQVSNDIIKMNNGMLTDRIEKTDPTTHAAEIQELNRYLAEKGIDFLYVQSSRKPDLELALLPEGTISYAVENADKMVELLKEANVPYLDLRPYISATPQMVEKYFYKTDHHWNAEGSFLGFSKIVSRIQEIYPDETIISENTTRESWELNIKENSFLGSHGRRTGIGYAGVDDLLWLTPKFETSISCAVPERQIFRKGSFADSVLDKKYIDSKPDYYNTNPYCIHTGGDYSHVRFRNPKAMSDKKVLFIKDSMGLPVEGYLSTVFKEVDSLDLRYLGNLGYTAAEKIADIQPDIVVMMINPSLIANDSVCNFGIKEFKESKTKPIIENKNFSIEGKEDKDFRHIDVAPLEKGKTYTLTINKAAVTGNVRDHFVATVYESAANKRYEYFSADLDYIEETDGEIRWILNTPKDAKSELRLLIYAGTPGQTHGSGLHIQGLSLYEGAVYAK